VLVAEAIKAGIASDDTLLTPKPPSFIESVAWSHCTSFKSELIMLHRDYR
jgi:hypothetical protein